MLHEDKFDLIAFCNRIDVNSNSLLDWCKNKAETHLHVRLQHVMTYA